jgi:molybdopterin converting factor small subunit
MSDIDGALRDYLRVVHIVLWGHNEREEIMKAAIIPGFAALRIKVNPNCEVTQGTCGSIEPGLYAPWPEAKKKGVVELEIEGETLRALLCEISKVYRQANVDFEPICPITNEVGFDFDVLINEKNYFTLAHGLDTKLKDGDEVKVKRDVIGHC